MQAKATWADGIPDEHWHVYRLAIDAARARQIPFALGGAFALAAYTGEFRPTKDLDIYVTPECRDSMVAGLTEAGLTDLYAEQEYDRGWIYRAKRDACIVDVIWGMANRAATVDPTWLTRAREIQIRGERLRVLPPEEFIWTKLYVLQRDRCDWPDILNVLYATPGDLDWAHMMTRMGNDLPLLSAALAVFAWMFPCRTREIPAWVREVLRVPPTSRNTQGESEERVRKIDSRPWFRQALSEETC